MRIALVTATELPRPDTDLPLLVDAFAARGAHAEPVAWDDPTADWAAFDVALLRSTWNYVAHLRAFREWLDRVEAATRLVNPHGTVTWNLHKRYLHDLAGAGVAVVPTELVPHAVQPDWNALFDRFGELVVKPAISAGSFATVRVAAGDVRAAREHRQAHADRDLLVQPLLASVMTHGEDNLVHLGGTFSHAIHKGPRWAGQPEQSRGLVQPADDELALARDVLRTVAELGHGTPAYARVDVARAADGTPVLMELELVEPALYLDRAPRAAGTLADAVLARA